MEFIDPFPTKCEFCNESNIYPVKELLAYKAICKSCGSKLIDGPLEMHKGKRSVAIELRPATLIWEACEKFDLDLECISDEEFDDMRLVSDFLKNIEKMGFDGELESILELSSFKRVSQSIDPSKLGQYSVEELAVLAYPEVKPG
ncbi:hypothetical protein [Microbulbifer sp. MCCC 1A16149]|uniref:hypothetical protein n=1 Tax=Microbulbifer sp. MCCC 1A16149 TaxID=3411322 RepID=UPI003D13EBF0